MPKIQTVHVVYKKSPYEIYIQKYRDPRMTSLIDQDDPSMEWMRETHDENQEALAHVKSVLKERGIKARWSYRARREPLDGVDLVLAVGGDGTLLEAARMIVDDTPLLGLRSTPSQSVGYLCATDATHVEEMLDAFEADQHRLLEVARIEAFHNGQPMLPLALNDILFAHVSPAATSRYDITLQQEGDEDPHVEHHRSSGVWIATPVGSTAAIHSAGGQILPPDAKELQFAVRELYKTPENTSAQIEHGFIQPGEHLEIVSEMRRAFLFFDGPWVKRPVHYGDTVRFQASDSPISLVKK